MKRLTEKKFPTYAHRPGETLHPNKAGGHSFELAAPPETRLSVDNYHLHAEYLFGIDLYNFGYFWESHVYWESAWNGCKRKGEIANFIKALILLAAGRLKLELGQEEVGCGHFKRSLELLESNVTWRDTNYLGLNFPILKSEIQNLIQNRSQQHVLNIEELFENT